MAQQKQGSGVQFKVAVVFIVLGFMNAVLAAGITYYLNSRPDVSQATLQAWSRNSAIDWLWPSGIMLMAADRSSHIVQTVILLFSIVANASLYGIIGLIVGTVWQRLGGRLKSSANT